VDLDVVLEQLGTIGDILASGSPQQQRRALVDLFERIEVGLRGNITAMYPKGWAQALVRLAGVSAGTFASVV
jgi:hypothetical protein